jgi:hypothetical protein
MRSVSLLGIASSRQAGLSETRAKESNEQLMDGEQRKGKERKGGHDMPPRSKYPPYHAGF